MSLRFVSSVASAGVLAFALVTAGPAEAALFSLSSTGAALQSNSDVTFPGRTPTVAGSQLVYGTGTASNEQLFSLNVLGSGVLAATDDFTLNAALSLNTPSTFVSPILAVTNGTRFVGGIAFDQINSSFNTPTGSFFGRAANATSLSSFTFNPNTTSDPYFLVADTDPMLLELEVGTTLAGRTYVTFKLVGTSVTGSTTVTSTQASTDLDPSLGLKLVFAARDASSEFAVNSLDVTLIPEPAALALMLAGGLLMLRRRRDHDPI